MLRAARLAARRVGLRFGSSTSSAALRLRMYDALRTHYQSLGDTEAYSAQLARQHTRWLIEGAQAKSGPQGWQAVAEKMVIDDIVGQNKPLAYVLGDAPFHPLPAPLIIRPPTLIPRPETEDWVAHLASVLAAHLVNSPVSARPFRILDIGTGTGCIPIGLAFGLSASPSAIMRSVELVGVDITDSAVQLANENVARLSPMLPESTRLSISVHKGDVFADDAAAALLGAEGEGFDLVVSNPPYIAPADFDALDPSVKNWEDRGALVGERMSTPADDEDQRAGLVFYRRIVQLLPKLLRSPLPADSASGNAAPPAVVFEVGAGQAESVKGMLEAATYETEVRRDQWGLDRVVIACRGP